MYSINKYRSPEFWIVRVLTIAIRGHALERLHAQMLPGRKASRASCIGFSPVLGSNILRKVCQTLITGTALPGLVHAALPEVQVRYAPVYCCSKRAAMAEQQVLPASFNTKHGRQDHTWVLAFLGEVIMGNLQNIYICKYFYLFTYKKKIISHQGEVLGRGESGGSSTSCVIFSLLEASHPFS